MKNSDMEPIMKRISTIKAAIGPPIKHRCRLGLFFRGRAGQNGSSAFLCSKDSALKTLSLSNRVFQIGHLPGSFSNHFVQNA